MPDITLTTGADTSGVATGLAQLRNQVTTASEEIKSSFVSSFGLASAAAAAFSVEGLKAIIDRAHDIHHEAERFGVDAQQLQIIGNAAKENGISLEQVAQAMNRLALVTEKQQSAIEGLGISTDYFLKLNPEERFYAIADAIQKNGVNTETYTAAVTLLGRRAGGELIPVLAQGSEAIKQMGAAMGTMSDETISALEKAHKAWADLSNFFQVFVGGILSIVVNAFRTTYAGIINAGQELATATIASFKAVDAAMHLDWNGVKAAFEQGNAEIAKLNQDLQEKVKDIWHPQDLVKGTQAVVGAMDDLSASATTATGNVRGAASAVDNLAAIEERNRVAALDSEQKLQDLLAQRQGLLDTLNSYAERGLLSDEEELKLKTEIATLDGQIGEAERAKASEQDAYNQKLTEELDTIEKQKGAMEEEATESRFIAAGHSEIAERLKEQYAIQQQIDDLTERINEAWSEGQQTLAEDLTDLRDMLQTQKDLVGAVKEYNRAAAATSKTTSALRGGNIGGSGLDQTDLTNMPQTQALIGQDSRYGFGLDYAQAYAAYSGHSDDATIAQYLKQYAGMTDFGTRNLSGVEQANLDRIKNWLVAHPAATPPGAAPEAGGSITVPPISNDLGNFVMDDTVDPLTQRDNWARQAATGVAPPTGNFLNNSVFTDIRAAFGVGGFLHNDIAGIYGPGGFLGGSGATPPIATPAPQPVTIDPGSGFDLGTTNGILRSIDQKVAPPPG